MAKKFSTHEYTFVNVIDAGEVKGSCANCGLGIRYMAIFKHNETGKFVHIGQDCLANSTPEQKKEFTDAQKMAQVDRKRNKLIAANPILQDLFDYCQANPFVAGLSQDGHIHQINSSLHAKFGGQISDQQIQIVKDYLTKDGE